MKLRISILIAIIILGGVYNMLFISNGLETSKYSIVNKIFEEDKIILEGGIVNSSMKCKGYSYKFKDGNLYIEVYGSIITPFDKRGIDRSGDFKIVIDRNEFDEEIENIYFQGNRKKDRKKVEGFLEEK